MRGTKVGLRELEGRKLGEGRKGGGRKGREGGDVGGSRDKEGREGGMEGEEGRA